MPYLIQLLHPGPQPSVKGDLCDWNTTEHKRKFLKAKGAYLDENFKLHEGTIYFWGEYEAPTDIERLQNNKHPWPIAIHEPKPLNFIAEPPEGALNTDPYVFDGNFYYTNCLQLRGKILKELTRGSIILFGSRIGGKFCIDTVFVVKDSFEYTPDNFDSLPYSQNVSERFKKIVIIPLTKDESLKNKSFKFYIGATYSNPVRLNGKKIFSFVPCGTPSNHPRGFLRSEFSYKDYISPKLFQNFKSNKLPPDEMVKIWEDIKNQIFKKALFLGVKIL